MARELYEETRGQLGLTCWFGELLTETYNHDIKKPITMYNFKEAYGAATHILPNNNILNIISKVQKKPYDEKVIELFPIYPFDLAAARIYAELWAQLLREGKMIGAHDLMIGSTAMALGFSVATCNKREFDRIEGLKVELLPS